MSVDSDLWFEFIEKGLCGLCGNSGFLDTTKSAVSPTGVECGVRRPCICPNGRAIKAHLDAETCYGCKHVKMYACSQGRSAYPKGNADNCKPTKKRKGFEPQET